MYARCGMSSHLTGRSFSPVQGGLSSAVKVGGLALGFGSAVVWHLVQSLAIAGIGMCLA